MAWNKKISDWDNAHKDFSKELWNHVKESVRISYMAINRLPNWTYPGGHKEYYEVMKQDGELAWPIITWRSAWHFLAGVGLALPMNAALPAWTPERLAILIPWAAVTAFSIYKEYKEGVGSMKKKVIDVLGWSLGGLAGALL